MVLKDWSKLGETLASLLADPAAIQRRQQQLQEWYVNFYFTTRKRVHVVEHVRIQAGLNSCRW